MKNKLIYVIMLIPFLSLDLACNNETRLNPGDPCDCATVFHTSDFPYFGTYEIYSITYESDSNYLFQKWDDFNGDFSVLLATRKSFYIDCDITLDTFDINFLIEGTYTYEHSCIWMGLQGTNLGWCELQGIGLLNIENSTISNLKGNNIEFNYNNSGVNIEIPLDNSTDKIKVKFP